MRLFLLFSERKKLVEFTKFPLIFLQAHVGRLEKLPTCPWSRTRASTQTLNKNQMLIRCWSTSVKSCLKFITQKKSQQNCLFLKLHFPHESRNLLKRSSFWPYRERVSRAIVRVSVYASSFWLYSAVVFCEQFISLEVQFIQISM